MKGHVRRRGTRSWAVILDLPPGEDGKRRQKWHAVKGTKRDAERELARLIHSLNTASYVEPTKTTLAEYLERWLETVEPTLGARTFHRYAEIARKHLVPALGNQLLAKLQPLAINAYYAKALKSGRRDGKGGLAARTVLHHHRVLREALQQAVKWQILARNPDDAASPPKPAYLEMRALTEAETVWLMTAAQGLELATPVLLAVTCGLRRGEVLAVGWRDVDLEAGTLTVRRSLEQTPAGLAFKEPKNRKPRMIDLPSLMIEELVRRREEAERQRRDLGERLRRDDLVVARPDGSPWRPDSFTPAFRKFLERAGLEGLRFHDLRHTHATQLLRQGVNPKIVSERLGHSSVAFTLQTYAHVLPTMQREAAGALDRALRNAFEQQNLPPGDGAKPA